MPCLWYVNSMWFVSGFRIVKSTIVKTMMMMEEKRAHYPLIRMNGVRRGSMTTRMMLRPLSGSASDRCLGKERRRDKRSYLINTQLEIRLSLTFSLLCMQAQMHSPNKRAGDKRRRRRGWCDGAAAEVADWAWMATRLRERMLNESSYSRSVCLTMQTHRTLMSPTRAKEAGSCSFSCKVFLLLFRSKNSVVYVGPGFETSVRCYCK